MPPPNGDRIAGLYLPPEWAEVFRAAPRHLFAPNAGWDADRRVWIDRTADPENWWATVYGDTAIVTQIDDGATELTAETVVRTANYTCSLSAPGVVLDFLRLLAPDPGDQTLEIGTGTGWTCALLSARVGDRNVTSVEVDPRLAERAAANLELAAFAPTLIVGDGALGWADRAPYDRVHVTCGVREIPYTWVTQTRPGGVIVAPWMAASGARLKVRFVIAANGTAVGRFHGGATYMLLRGQREPLVPIHGERRESPAGVDPRRLDQGGAGLRVALAGLLPGVTVGGGVRNPVDGTFRLVVRDLASDSHAIAVAPPDDGAAQVTQRGPRDLWDELVTAYRDWVSWGEPDAERFGLDVTPDGQRVWLDRPATPVERRT
ncbi:methyltransferase domain-containing protein [Marinitenerispora sediminis]|uniref:Protein-L-isoaspartate O-methyltransferase n=1 Tax=Marinitenerispora sediminis TaxID=1931232 RepID=A0A368T354_9ACTN|nr:rRNA adenine N-6-methyltransferase family protein [Marinitenerispora sediminis]RCV55976.1 hypothetical protein DEF24_17260 [Marinitenerispora sediminis]RCV56267.1 hypothetical protein DEF28_03890 [Marinitenerispora sediminis]RCV61200.1 hypothetical protein DEF23_02810 [Marinitenerispora sediminis]